MMVWTWIVCDAHALLWVTNKIFGAYYAWYHTNPSKEHLAPICELKDKNSVKRI